MIEININNWTAKLTGDRAILETLYEELSFKHPQAYYIKQRITRNWDGVVYPLTKSGTISVGMLSKVETMLTEMGVDVEITDHRVIPEVEEVPSVIGGATLRGYQRVALGNIAFNKVLGVSHPRGIVAAGVGAGKTLMMFGCYQMFGKLPTIILVNNTALFNQIKDDLKKAFPNEYGFLKGKEYRPGSITVVMTQTAIKRINDMDRFFKGIRVLLVDEADDQVNDSLRKVIKACPYAPIRLGFTGTSFVRDLVKDQLRNYQLEAMFGSELYSINTEELSKEGYTTSTQVKIIPGDIAMGSFSYNEEVSRVTSSDRTKKIILRRIKYNLKHDRKYIMIYNRFIPVAEEIAEFLARELPHLSVGVLDHKKYKDNPETLERFRKGDIQILVNTLFLKRGINLPKVRVIINNACGDYPSTTLQVLGRGVRLDSDKPLFYFEDIFHEGAYVSSHNKSRLKAYKKYGYPITDFRD